MEQLECLQCVYINVAQKREMMGVKFFLLSIAVRLH